MPDKPIQPEGWSCPLPLKDYPNIVMGHGTGAKLSSDLIEHLFIPAFRNPALDAMADSAVLEFPAGRLAFTTDSHVVRPLFFPGGSIGELAVHGTVNDLAMAGARPLYLSAAFILEEGFPIEQLSRIVYLMAESARRAGVKIVTGDTKVVERGHGDGCYITTAGVGVVPAGRTVGPDRARSGDAIIISGTMGDHGMAIMSVREGLEFETQLTSDTAPLNELVETLFQTAPKIRALRDPTRGGVAATLTEFATRSNVGILIEETALPIRAEVKAACELLGLDPLMVANEGKLIAVVPAEDTEVVLASLRKHELGRSAARIGTVVSEHPGMVAARTAIGGKRVVTLPYSEQLPRIC